MFTLLYFILCLHYSLLTTKSLVSIHHHKVDPLYLFGPPPTPPFPSRNYYSALCIYVCFCLVWFICLWGVVFYIYYTNELSHTVSVFLLLIIALRIIPSWSIHVMATGKISPFFFFFMAE